MSNYENILIPTDFSKVSMKAAGRCRRIAEAIGARVTVLHVVDYVPPNYASAELPAGLGSNKAIVKNARTQLTKWVEKAGLADATLDIVTGPAKSQIIRKVKEMRADLLVMGTHGEHGIVRLLGSTTRAVLHDAVCDVLVVTANDPD